MAQGLLTQKQAEFVRQYASGVPKCEAARLAGYVGADTEPSRLLALPHVVAALDAEYSRRLDSVRRLAIGRLEGLLASDTTTGLLLVSAIKVALVDRGSSSKKPAGDGKALADMTYEELEDTARKIRATLHGDGAIVIDNSANPPVAPAPTMEDVFGTTA